jgi:hypothetical protein
MADKRKAAKAAAYLGWGGNRDRSGHLLAETATERCSDQQRLLHHRDLRQDWCGPRHLADSWMQRCTADSAALYLLHM